MTYPAKIDQPYYGKWGGFFVPDPMTPALDELSAAAEALLQSNALQAQIENLVEALSPRNPGIQAAGSSKKIYTTLSPARWFVAAGYAVLAKTTGREIVCGAASVEEAKILTAAAKKLALPVSMWLNVACGSNDALVKELTDAGVSLNVNQCRELFDDPDMYAFQKFIANPAKFLWAPVHTHSGPHPFVSLTAYFARLAAEKLIHATGAQFKGQTVTFAAPAFPGIALAGLVSANSGSPLSLISYEPKADLEKDECYLGTYTRVKIIGKKDFILSPVVVNAWETGKVKRLETPTPIETLAETDPARVFVVVEE